VVLQAFIDDSYNPDGVFVLGGYIATAEAWASFSKAWEELLPYGTLTRRGKYHFKMAEMAMNAARMARVSAFYRVIEAHILGYVSCKIDISDLNDIHLRLRVGSLPLLKWGMLRSPYYVAFRGLLDMFHRHRDKMTAAIPLDEKIDFYFDNQSEKGALIATWDRYMMDRPEDVRKHFGATPRFEDDEDFLPLQAADFWAWWVRKWYTEGTPEKIDRCDFGVFRGGEKSLLRMKISFNRVQLSEAIRSMLRTGLGPNVPIYEI
jgi:Protein of unknown function (DUF3800)